MGLGAGVSCSPHAQAALRWAVEEAKLRHASVSAVHVWQPLVEGYPYSGFAYDPGLLEVAARALLDEAVDAVVVPGQEPEVARVVVCGGAASALLEQAEVAELVVVGSRGRGGFSGLVLGSVSQQVAYHARCPVVIVRS